MKKKLLVLTLVLATICSLCIFMACNGSTSKTPNDESQSGNPTQPNDGDSSNVENKPSEDAKPPSEEQSGAVNNTIFLTNKGQIVGVTDYGKTQNEIVIPSKIGEEEIVSIGEGAFNGCDILTSIEIPKCIEEIHYKAFEGCGNLTAYFEGIDLPSGWSELCWDVENNLLVPIVRDYINNNVADDGNIYFVDGYVRYALKNKKATVVGWLGVDKVEISNKVAYNNSQYDVTSIGDFAFYKCDRIASIEIPNNVEEIGLKTFYSCSRLQSVDIPSNVCSIGSEAFANCRALKNVNFASNNNLTNIGNGAFSYCNKLESIEIPNKVKSLDNDTFSNCDALRIITFEKQSTLTGIYNNAFYGCKSIERLDIPDSVSYIGSLAFAKCSALKVLSFGENSNLENIDNGAFRDCFALFDLTIPATTTNIGTGAFAECNNIIKVSLPITALNCIPIKVKSNLKEIVINGGESIESNAFVDFPALIEIEIAPHFTNISKNAFLGCNITSATIPASAISAMPKETLKRVVINGGEGIGKYSDVVGEYSKDEIFFNCKSLEEVVIKGDVSEIRSHAFYGCSNLTKVEIGMGVESIEDYVFYGCEKLTTMLIPASVGYVANTAFENCDSLKTIYCEFSKKDSIHLEDENNASCQIIWDYNHIFTNSEYDYVLHDGQAYLTSYKGNNTNIVIPQYIDGNLVAWWGDAYCENKNIQSVHIPEWITKIDCGAFYNCVNLKNVTFAENSKCTSIEDWAFSSDYLANTGNIMQLNNIVLPDTITHIGSFAFAFCTSLESITIPKSVTNIGANAFLCCAALTTINCEATSKPQGWDSDWNRKLGGDSYHNVVWGYSEEYKK